MSTYRVDIDLSPDTRFDIKLTNLKFPLHVFPEKETAIGAELFAIPPFGNGDSETVIGIAIPGCSEYTRKQTDELTDWVKRPQIGMKGLVYIKVNHDGTFKSSVDKFYDQEELKNISDSLNAAPGDLILLLAGAEEKTRKAISDLRLYMGERLGFRKPEVFKLLWVLDFPLFEYDESNNRWVARHHPFTSPKPDHIEAMISNDAAITDAASYLQHPYSAIKANAYDMVLNGNEIGGGSIRIYQKGLQEKMFEALKMDSKEQHEKFGFFTWRI